MTDLGSLKRKRNYELHCQVLESQNEGFTNAGFSSTPKKIIEIRKRKMKSTIDKENKPFTTNPCLEVKSIAELAGKNNSEDLEDGKNPYEIVRKPPKKKRDIDIESACFENAALNLEIPEKQFNPFEVPRDSFVSKQQTNDKCFVNEALNIRGQDTSPMCNPFEVQRSIEESVAITPSKGIGNQGFNSNVLVQPTLVQIGLPFQPTIDCRIDFSDIQLSDLTPSKIMFEKLAFSPINTKPKRSLDAISEESSSVSIGRELDRYQLELENSINEAKLRTSSGLHIDNVPKPKVPNVQVHLDAGEQQTPKKPTTLTVISEEAEDAEEDIEVKNDDESKESKESPEIEQEEEIYVKSSNTFTVARSISNADQSKSEHTSKDVEPVSSDSEFEDESKDAKLTQRFVRTYRRDKALAAAQTSSKESISSQKSSKAASLLQQDTNQMGNVKHLIRKSIRKIMHPMQHHNNNKQEHQSTADINIKIMNDDVKETKNENVEKNLTCKNTNVFTNIRHSLRRKPQRKLLLEEEDNTIIGPSDCSIIDTGERTMKLKTNISQTEYIKVEELTYEKKHFIGNGLRSSMRAVLRKKKEQYIFAQS